MGVDSVACSRGCAALLIAGLCSGRAADVARDGLLLSWEASSLRDVPGPTSLPDGGEFGNHARLLDDARFADGPPRNELNGTGSLAGERPVRPRRMTCEAVFRVDSTDGPLQLVFSTFPPEQRLGSKGANARQWVLEIRGDPCHRGLHHGFLEFGVFGTDGRWRVSRSGTCSPRPTRPRSRGASPASRRRCGRWTWPPPNGRNVTGCCD